MEPGRWGRVIKQMGPKHKAWNREMYLEHIRQKEFPAKPTRLNATFSCLNRIAIDFYRQHHCPLGILYEVTIADQSAALHVGDFKPAEPPPRRPETMGRSRACTGAETRGPADWDFPGANGWKFCLLRL